MAKILIAGDAAVVKSNIKYSELKTLEKYNPDALILYEGEEKEPVFRIAAGGDAGYINDFGIVFPDGEGDKPLTLTVVVAEHENDVKEFVADKLGIALDKLTKLEQTIPAAVNAAAAARASVLASIEVIG